MNTSITLSIQMFGAFRQYHQGELNIEVPSGCNILTVKKILAQALRQSNSSFENIDLLNRSAIADHQRVYRNDEEVPDSVSLAILPPVCGG